MLQGEDWGGGKGSKAVVVDMESYWGRREGGGVEVDMKGHR